LKAKDVDKITWVTITSLCTSWSLTSIPSSSSSILLEIEHSRAQEMTAQEMTSVPNPYRKHNYRALLELSTTLA